MNVDFGKDTISFFAGVVKIADRARARGEFDTQGDPIWSVAEWAAFCKGARAYKHMGMIGVGIRNTVAEVEAMIADEYDAASIHAVLKGYDYERELKNDRRDPKKLWYQEPAA